MSNWETVIFAYLDHPITNAYTESGWGYSFSAIRPKLLYAKTARKRPRAGLLRFSTKAASELTRSAAVAD